MDSHKISRLASIQKEVDELHQLLKVLFRKLPHITNIEYKQGPHEMGTDFVLSKRDETLGGTEYIGNL